MRIGIDGREFVPGKKTGTARYLQHFLTEGPRLKPDWEFFVFLHHHCSYRNARPNVFVQKVYQPSSFLWDQMLLPFLLKRFAIDRFLNPYLKCPLVLPSPMTLIINDIAPYDLPLGSRPKRLLRHLYFRVFARVSAKKAKRILTISEYSKGRIVSRFGILSERIHVVPLAVDPSYHPLSKTEPEIPERYGIRAPYLLYIGDTRPQKNVSFLLDCFSKLPVDLRNRYSLVIGGSREEGIEPLRQKGHRLGIGGALHFCGFIPEEDLPKLYAQAALFLYPSLYEGFGLPPLEAAACGVPVICSNRASLPEVIGEGGFLLPPDDPLKWSEAMGRLLTDETARKEWIEKGKRRAASFTLEKTTSSFLRLLEE